MSEWTKQTKNTTTGQGFLVGGFLEDGFLVGPDDEDTWTKQDKDVAT